MLADLLEEVVRDGEAAVERTPEQLEVLQRVRRRRRRRPRPGGDHRRHRRRAARRHRGARGRAPRCRRATPARTTPTAATATAPTSSSPAAGWRAGRSFRGWRSSATPCWWSATRRRSRSTSTPTSPRRRWRCSRARARSPSSTSPTCASRSPSAPRGCRPAAAAVVAVAAGEGMRELYEELGAFVVDGGETFNPSIYDLLAAIHEVPSEEVAGPAQQPQRGDGGRARGGALGQARPGWCLHLPAGRPGGDGRDRPRAVGRGERRAARLGGRRGQGRLGGPRRPRRRPGALRHRRRGRLRRRTRSSPGAAPASGARRDDGGARRGCRDPHRRLRRRAPRSRSGRWRATRPTAPRSSFTTAASRTTGGCSPPSSGPPPLHRPSGLALCRWRPPSSRRRLPARNPRRPPMHAFAPRAIGSGEPLDRETLLAAPVRSPRPGILDAPLTKLRGAGPKLSEAAAEIGISSLGDLLRHLPHSYRDRASPIGLADLKLGEEATVEVGRHQGRQGAADAPPPPHHPRGRGRGRDGTDHRHLVQPGLARGQADAGDEAAAAGQAREARLQRRRARAAPGTGRERGCRMAKPSRREFTQPAWYPIHPASERLRPQKLREWAWQAVPLAPQRAGAAPGEPAGRGRDARRRRRAGRLPLPRRRGRRRRRPAADWPSRSCCSTRPRSPPGAGAARSPAGGPRSGPSASGWAAGSTRCRSSSPATSARRSTTSTATSPGPSRCSGC